VTFSKFETPKHILAGLMALVAISPVFAQTTPTAITPAATISPAAPTPADMVTFNISLGVTTLYGGITGSISYALDGIPLGSVAIVKASTGAQSIAISLGNVALGGHVLSYSYAGDAHYAAGNWSFSFQVSETPFTYLGSSVMILYNEGDLGHVAIDSRDNAYFSSRSSNVILKRDTHGSLTTYPTTGLNTPQGVAFDSADNLYIADQGNSRVVKVTPAGVQTTLPVSTTGPLNLTFDNSRQNLYITDQPAQKILVFNLAASTTSVYASGLYNIFDVAFDPSGILYYSQRYSYSPGTLTRVQASGPTVVTTPLNSPGGMVFDKAGNLYVTDFGSGGTWTMSPNGNFQQLTQLGNEALAMDSRGVLYFPGGNSYAFSRKPAAFTNQSIAFPAGGGFFAGGTAVSDASPTVYYTSSSTEWLSSLTFPNPSSPFRTYAGVTCIGNRLCYEPFVNSFVHPGPQSDYVVATSNLGTQLTNIVYGVGVNSELAFNPGGIGNEFSATQMDSAAFGSFAFLPTGDIFGTVPGYNSLYFEAHWGYSGIGGSGFVGGPVGIAQAPTQIAADALSNVYFLESGTSRILRGGGAQIDEYLPDPTFKSTVLFDLSAQTALHTLTAFALDSATNLWIGGADANGNGVILLQDSGGNSKVFATGTGVPVAMTVDGIGVLYSVDAGGTLRNFDAVGNSRILASGLLSPRSIAVEPSGVVYVANGVGDLAMIKPDGSTAAYPIAGVTSPAFVAFDFAGNLAVGFVNLQTNQSNAYVFDRTHSQGYSFSNVMVNTVTPALASQLMNVGNLPLSFSAVPGGSGPFVLSATANTCTTSAVLAPGGQCDLNFVFHPTALQSWSQTAYITDSTGGASAANSQFTVPFTGTGVASVPVVTVPATITVEATGGWGVGTIVTFVAAATDAVDGTLPVTCVPASGAHFSLGTTTVPCTATNHAGIGSSKSFKIIVRDTTAPTLTLPANITAAATSANGATVNFTASATDTVDGADTVTCFPASGSTFAVGTATVTCSSADNAGNTAKGTFTVTVNPSTTLITLSTSFYAIGVSVDGIVYTSAFPQPGVTLALSPGIHTIAVPQTQLWQDRTGYRYIFDGWSDGGAASHSITVGTSPASYYATFHTQLLLTTIASPAAGGSVTASQFVDPFPSTVSLTAVANAGYVFAGFSAPFSVPAGNPTSFQILAPETVVANFTPLAPNLAASVGTRADAGTNRQVVLNLVNTGLGNASNATITGISAAVVLGSGAVSAVSHLPVDLGAIAPGASASTAVLFNWPAAATKVKLTVTFTADNGYTGSTSITTLR
jgi:sugar lactone lactonase YvrE